ncbi:MULTISPECIES: hypothetical protein [unclassified Polaribacter]|jgi:hypothetical protein|uniref:hypothetical protein n=1 Tax=unclassified Polaribacter TaxID=196858 RepID=UPI001C4F8370|nr:MULTISPECIES: hypothetical protein [unclassified Polaribacter]QXP63930.1 hypothetical protein H0I27_01645 [Polaribacter sp. HaHaR_3_91]QXP66430.1 hypothetical protein H0I28_14805 [Polaribacter sp. AHE13PA]
MLIAEDIYKIAKELPIKEFIRLNDLLINDLNKSQMDIELKKPLSKPIKKYSKEYYMKKLIAKKKLTI